MIMLYPLPIFFYQWEPSTATPMKKCVHLKEDDVEE